MEANHQIGILQTVPQAINGESIWSRLQQFAMSLYGPIFAAGANFWQQEESNFWGHNAIIRLAPFIQHCALPELPGRNPTGKRPMSHDFVEAALMRRAGWEVHLADDLGGSYEETPPTVVEHLKRDRRWCQGNLQHWSFALAHGFRPVTRFHFLHGIFSFLASPLLMVVLALGFLKNLSGAHLGESIFIDVARARIAFLLFAFTMLLLLVPKLLGIVLALRGERAHRFGGAARMMGSAFLEIIISILMAPVFLFFHAKFVLFTWLGKQVQWHAQQRECSAGRAWAEALETFSLTTLFGVAAGAITYWLTPSYFFWLLPILAGWILVIPITALISNRSTGMMLRKFRFLLVPSEVKPDEQIRNLRRALRTSSQAPVADAMAATIVHPILQRCFSKIAPDESAELHRQIWSTPAADLSPRWHRELTALEMRAF
jgi:membrane glycosyltransferase